MLIIGCDYHPSFQQIAFVNNETGGISTRFHWFATAALPASQIAIGTVMP